MSISPVAQRLLQSGLALFFAGLVLGFLVKALPNPKAALSAHLNAVQSGTFLIALGLAWTHLAVWPRFASPLATSIWLSFWGLEVGMILAALVPAGGGGALKTAAQIFIGGDALLMFVAVGALLIPFGRR